LKRNLKIKIMSFIQRIAKNTGVFLTAQAISYVLSFFFFVYIARYLGAEGFGIFSFALALTAIFGIFSDLGLRQVTTREVARDKSLTKKYLGNIAGMKIILVIVVLAALVLFVNLAGYPEETIKIVYLIGLSIVFTAFLQMFYGIFQAYERMEFESVGNILKNSLLLISALFVITNNLSILTLAFFYFLASAITLGYALIISLWKFVRPKIEIDWSFLKPTLKEALPFGLIGIFGMFLHWIDTVMLSIMKGETVVGWYSAAYRIFFVLLLIPSAFDMAIFPVMSRFYISSKNSLKFIYEKSLKYLILIGIPIGVGGTLLADKIILLIFGKEYQPSIIAFQILIWSAVLIFMGTPFSSLLNSTNKQVVLAKIIGISVAVNIFLNLLLIPKYSYIGASITTVISVFLILLGVMIVASRIGYKIPISKIVNPILKAAISGLIMGTFIVYFKNINLFLLITFSAMIYFVVIYFIKGLDKEDLAVIKVLSRRK